MNRLDATEHLRRQMHEMLSMLESALPCLGSPGGQSRTPVTTSSPQQAAIPSAPSDGQHASEVPVNQVFQPEACHAIAGPSVVVNAESGGRGGGMLSAPSAMVSCIDDSILNLPGTTQGRVSKCIATSPSLHGHVLDRVEPRLHRQEREEVSTVAVAIAQGVFPCNARLIFIFISCIR